MTRSKLCESNGSLSMPREANAFFMIGQATNSVVPGATVVSINVRQCGCTFWPIVRMVASSAVISASPDRMLPSSCLVKSHCTSTTTQSANDRQSLLNVAVSVFLSLTHRAIIGSTSGSSALTGDSQRFKRGISQ